MLLASLLLLPVVVMTSIAKANVAQMELQADEISTLASGIRAYYADNVIARLQAADGRAQYSEDYRNVHGGIPIPATLSIELGALFDNAHTDGRIGYEFLSDYPFAKRVTKALDPFEREALQAFRADPQLKEFRQLKGSGLGRSTYRLATPVIMRQACVTCHNSHPDSPRRNWKVGDIRGIQEVTVNALQVDGFGNLLSLFVYVGIVGVVSLGATTVFQRQSNSLARLNKKLQDSNKRESDLALKLTDQLQELSIFGSVVDDSIVGISIADMRKPDAPLIYVNNAFTRTTGYSRELAIGFNCRFLQGPKTDPAELAALREALREGKSYTGELINYRQDGSTFWNRLTLYPIYLGETNTPEYYVANQVDVTTLKQHSGLSIGDIHRVSSELSAAQRSLDDADRFSRAIQEQASQFVQAPEQLEAFLIADRSAHHKLAQFLQLVSTMVAKTAV